MSLRAHAAFAALLLLIEVLQQGAVQGCSNVKALSEQLDGLLALYDREQAPARPARVQLALDVHHATVQPDGTVHILADLTLSWNDPRTVWNTSEWGCDSVVTSPDRLWLPEVALLNGAGSEAQTPLGARLRSDGRVVWLLRYDAAVPLSLDLARWPHDTQTAVVKFGSRTKTVDELDLDISNVTMSVVFEAGAWELEAITSSVSGRAGGAHVVAGWAARLKRRAAAQAAAATAVLAAVSLTLLAAALLPPARRAPLCACASFTAAIWLVSAASQVPGAASAPRSMRALGALCATAGGAALAAAAALRLAARSGQPPRPLVALASALSRWCTLTPDQEWCPGGERGAWVALAQLLDHALSAVVLVTVLACVCLYW